MNPQSKPESKPKLKPELKPLFDLPRPSIRIQNSDNSFPVNRIYCVGRNYAAHAKEMGSTEREAPFFFGKPANAVCSPDSNQPGMICRIPYPPRTADLHHEVELVVGLAKGGSNLSVEAALQTIYGYGVGVDFTRRDLQAAAKVKGRPWDTAKGFDFSAPVSELLPVDRCGHLTEGSITLSVNGELRQQGDLRDMIWSTGEIIAELSTYYELSPGDLIFTGTPSGVGAVSEGDSLEAEINGLTRLHIEIC